VYFDLSSIADNYLIAMRFRKLLLQQIHKMPEHFLFGSGYEGCDIKEHVDFINQLDISDIEKEMVFYNNAKRLYLCSSSETAPLLNPIDISSYLTSPGFLTCLVHHLGRLNYYAITEANNAAQYVHLLQFHFPILHHY